MNPEQLNTIAFKTEPKSFVCECCGVEYTKECQSWEAPYGVSYGPPDDKRLICETCLYATMDRGFGIRGRAPND